MPEPPDQQKPLVPLRADPRDGSETVAGGRATVTDFWRWAYSDLRDNVSRGVLAEWLVGLSLGCVKEGVRTAWGNFDLICDGIRIEVKSAAYLQAWTTPRHSRISFGRLSGIAWDADTGKWDTARTYRADVYVFAIQTAREHSLFDPLDVAQWEFWVADQAAVKARGVRSLSLAGVKALAKGPLEYKDLPVAVRSAAERNRPGT